MTIPTGVPSTFPSGEKPGGVPFVGPDPATEIENWFTYHRPTADQAQRYQEIREQAKVLAKLVLKNCPPCADRTAALRDLRKTVNAINASIACNEPDADAKPT